MVTKPALWYCFTDLLSWPSPSERNGSFCDLSCIKMNKSNFLLIQTKTFESAEEWPVGEESFANLSCRDCHYLFKMFRHSSDAIVSCPAALGEFGLVVSEATSLLICRHWVDPSLQLLFWQDQSIFLQGNCSVTSQVSAIPTTQSSHGKFHQNFGCHTLSVLVCCCSWHSLKHEFLLILKTI